MSKKIKIILVVSVALLVLLLGFLVFRATLQKTGSGSGNITPGSTANSPAAPNSLKGVIANILSGNGANQAAKNNIPEQPTVPAAANPAASVPENSAPAGFSFAVIGDSRHFGSSPTGGLQLTASYISKRNDNPVMAMGDLINGCDGGSKCEAKYNAWKNILGSLMPKTYGVNGNHDATTSQAEAIWRKVFSFPTNGPAGFEKLVYSFDTGNSHFVVLDSENPSPHEVSPEQQAWLEKDLAADKKENTFVFLHEPLWATSMEEGDSMDVKPDQRADFVRLLDKYNVTAVFAGHEHLFSRKKIDSGVFPGLQHPFYQFVVGNSDVSDDDTPRAGASEYSYVGKSFAILDVNGKAVAMKLYSVDGKLVDTFNFSK